MVWVILGAAAAAIALLLWKIRLMQRAADEIGEAFSDKLGNDTNTLVDISSRDRHMRRLAGGVNGQLRLLRAQRLRYGQGDAELKAAVTNISHDLRTPLTAILGYADLLEKEELGEKARGYVRIIKSRAGALRELTEELLRYSVAASEEELDMEDVSLNAALEESIAGMYTALKERGIVPEISMPEAPVRRRLDRAALYRIFGNLLANAVKYSSGDLNVTLTPDGAVSFENTAGDIDNIQLEKLFDRFYTVENARRSTGLGLSIAKLLTERMGGKIWAELTEGKLKVSVKFPER